MGFSFAHIVSFVHLVSGVDDKPKIDNQTENRGAPEIYSFNPLFYIDFHTLEIWRQHHNRPLRS